MVVERVAEAAQVVFPPVLLHEELDVMLRDLDRRLRDQHLTLADYLKIEKKTEEELRTELEPRARQHLVRSLVLGKVVEAEGLKVDDAEVDAEIQRMSAPLKEQAESLRKLLDTATGRHRIHLDLLADKSVRRLSDIARGRAPEPESDATKKDEGTHA